MPFPIVKDGILANYTTTREGAGWLKSAYAKSGTPLRSNGCAVGGEDFFGGMHVPLAQTPNLIVTPGVDNTANFETLVSALDTGLAWKGMMFDLDFQQLNGIGSGKAYDIRNGKRVALMAGPGILFQATELLKNLTNLGGEASKTRYGLTITKGEPPQLAFHSVSAVPAAFKDVSVVDLLRKA